MRLLRCFGSYSSIIPYYKWLRLVFFLRNRCSVSQWFFSIFMDSRHLFYYWSFHDFIQPTSKLKYMILSGVLHFMFFSFSYYVVLIWNTAINNWSNTLMNGGTNKPRLLHPPLLCNVCMYALHHVVYWHGNTIICFDFMIYYTKDCFYGIFVLISVVRVVQFHT